ncbi:hypothetical protein FH972_024158 [Carpinus fangiana]|uniref:Uncharacterized protein n=1 Tax=Carpinus fangiana TaxID=176857 RepID=A0A5N6KXI6_9ROSI|nr:hypothetical protein FH972_024158 [Carpinus fangiana]
MPPKPDNQASDATRIVYNKITKSSANDPAFEQHLQDHGIHFKRAAKKPANLEGIKEALSRRRPSLSASTFTEADFEDFQDANDAARTEPVVMSTAFRHMVGKSKIPNLENVAFGNLAPITGTHVVTPRPDFYDGSQAGDLEPSIRDELKVKGSEGSMAVGQLQANHAAVLGARGMHELRRFINQDTALDGKAYTLSMTYVRNARDWASAERDKLIKAANERFAARQAAPASPPSSQSGRAAAEAQDTGASPAEASGREGAGERGAGRLWSGRAVESREAGGDVVWPAYIVSGVSVSRWAVVGVCGRVAFEEWHVDESCVGGHLDVGLGGCCVVHSRQGSTQKHCPQHRRMLSRKCAVRIQCDQSIDAQLWDKVGNKGSRILAGCVRSTRIVLEEFLTSVPSIQFMPCQFGEQQDMNIIMSVTSIFRTASTLVLAVNRPLVRNQVIFVPKCKCRLFSSLVNSTVYSLAFRKLRPLHNLIGLSGMKRPSITRVMRRGDCIDRTRSRCRSVKPSEQAILGRRAQPFLGMLRHKHIKAPCSVHLEVEQSLRLHVRMTKIASLVVARHDKHLCVSSRRKPGNTVPAHPTRKRDHSKLLTQGQGRSKQRAALQCIASRPTTANQRPRRAEGRGTISRRAGLTPSSRQSAPLMRANHSGGPPGHTRTLQRAAIERNSAMHECRAGRYAPSGPDRKLEYVGVAATEAIQRTQHPRPDLALLGVRESVWVRASREFGDTALPIWSSLPGSWCCSDHTASTFSLT